MANFPTTVAPDFNVRKISKPNIRIAQFGSGYSKRSTFGINQNLKIFNLTFTNITETESDEIETKSNEIESQFNNSATKSNDIETTSDEFETKSNEIKTQSDAKGTHYLLKKVP